MFYFTDYYKLTCEGRGAIASSSRAPLKYRRPSPRRRLGWGPRGCAPPTRSSRLTGHRTASSQTPQTPAERRPTRRASEAPNAAARPSRAWPRLAAACLACGQEREREVDACEITSEKGGAECFRIDVWLICTLHDNTCIPCKLDARQIETRRTCNDHYSGESPQVR